MVRLRYVVKHGLVTYVADVFANDDDIISNIVTASPAASDLCFVAE